MYVLAILKYRTVFKKTLNTLATQVALPYIPKKDLSVLILPGGGGSQALFIFPTWPAASSMEVNRLWLGPITHTKCNTPKLINQNLHS